MSAPSVLIAGCGDVGSRLATQLLVAGWQVHGLRRDVSKLPEGVIGVAGDLFNEECPATWPVGAVDYLVYCAAATDHDEEGYRKAYVQGLQNVLSWLDDYGQAPERVIFVSSSSVYGQQDGAWVDETCETVATGYSGRLMLEAEQVALNSGIPASVLRLTGIYGPGREWLLTQYVAATASPSSRRCMAIVFTPTTRRVCWRFCWRKTARARSWNSSTLV